MPDTSETLPTPAATATKAILASVTRHVLTAAGTALVTRGAIDQGTVDGMIPTAAEMLVGAIMVGAAQGWSLFRAWFGHTRFAAAIAALDAKPAG